MFCLYKASFRFLIFFICKCPQMLPSAVLQLSLQTSERKQMNKFNATKSFGSKEMANYST